MIGIGSLGISEKLIARPKDLRHHVLGLVRGHQRKEGRSSCPVVPRLASVWWAGTMKETNGMAIGLC